LLGYGIFGSLTAQVLLGLVGSVALFRAQLAADERRHRISLGKCAACSYDLTGNTSGVCPECGRPVAGKAGVEA
jgi:hypothetical protein